MEVAPSQEEWAEGVDLVARALVEDGVSFYADDEEDTETQDILIKGRVVSKEQCFVCGVALASLAFESTTATARRIVPDGAKVEAGDTVLEVEGLRSEILKTRSTALSILGFLSGTATQTSLYVDAVKGSGVKVFSTNDTIPTFRALQQWAVRCGGGYNSDSDVDVRNDMTLDKAVELANAGSTTELFVSNITRRVDPLIFDFEIMG